MLDVGVSGRTLEDSWLVQNPRRVHSQPVRVYRAVLPGVDASEEQLHQKVAKSKGREQRTVQRKPAQTSLSSAGLVRTFTMRVGIWGVLNREYSVLSSKMYHPGNAPSLRFPQRSCWGWDRSRD